MLVFAWKSCRNRGNIEQTTEKKADSPGVLSVYRCVIYDHLLWALDVSLAQVLGSKDCSRILQAFLTSAFVSSGLAYTCLHSKYSFPGGYLHRITWPDFAGDWLGSEKWLCFLLNFFSLFVFLDFFGEKKMGLKN